MALRLAVMIKYGFPRMSIDPDKRRETSEADPHRHIWTLTGGDHESTAKQRFGVRRRAD